MVSEGAAAPLAPPGYATDLRTYVLYRKAQPKESIIYITLWCLAAGRIVFWESLLHLLEWVACWIEGSDSWSEDFRKTLERRTCSEFVYSDGARTIEFM